MSEANAVDISGWLRFLFSDWFWCVLWSIILSALIGLIWSIREYIKLRDDKCYCKSCENDRKAKDQNG